MRRRIVTGGVGSSILAGALAAAMVATVPTGASTAASSNGHDRTAPAHATATGRVAAARSAAQLVAAKPEVLKAGKHESYRAGKVLSSMGLNYVPYERTYRGLPVVGGDFVVSTDDHGRILATSVAQTRKLKVRSTGATVSKATARAKSRHQLRHASLRLALEHVDGVAPGRRRLPLRV